MSLLSMNARDDRQLLEAYVGHADEEAFAALVERYAGLVLGVAQRATGSHELGEEVSQRVFIALAQKAKSLRKHPSLAGWLHRAVRMEVAHHFRKEGAHQRKIAAYANEVIIDEGQPVASAWEHLIPLVDDGLNALSSSEREILLLRFYRGVDFKGIGEVIGKSASAAQRQGHRALAKLSAYFERHRVGVSASMLAVLFESQLKATYSQGIAGQWKTAALSASTPSLLTRALAMPSVAAVGILSAVAVSFVWFSVAPEDKFAESNAKATSVSSIGLPQAILADAQPSSTLLGKRTALDPVDEVAAAMHEVLKNPDVGPTKERALRLERLMKWFSEEDWFRLLAKLEAFTDVPTEFLENMVSDVVGEMSRTAPKAAFEYAMRHQLSDGAIASPFASWIAADFESAAGWLKKQCDDEALEDGLETKLLEKYTDALSGRDQLAAMEMVRTLEGDDARRALIPLGVELGSKDQLTTFYELVRELIPEEDHDAFYLDFVKKPVRSKTIPPRESVQRILESVPVSAEERNSIMMAHAERLASCGGEGNGEEAIDRVARWSPRDQLRSNVHRLMNRMGRMHYDAAEEWIAEQEDVVLRDEATAGLAIGLSLHSSEDRWHSLIERIQDADIRNQATDTIAKIMKQIQEMKEKESAH